MNTDMFETDYSVSGQLSQIDEEIYSSILNLSLKPESPSPFLTSLPQEPNLSTYQQPNYNLSDTFPSKHPSQQRTSLLELNEILDEEVLKLKEALKNIPDNSKSVSQPNEARINEILTHPNQLDDCVQVKPNYFAFLESFSVADKLKLLSSVEDETAADILRKKDTSTPSTGTGRSGKDPILKTASILELTSSLDSMVEILTTKFPEQSFKMDEEIKTKERATVDLSILHHFDSDLKIRYDSDFSLLYPDYCLLTEQTDSKPLFRPFQLIPAKSYQDLTESPCHATAFPIENLVSEFLEHQLTRDSSIKSRTTFLKNMQRIKSEILNQQNVP
jgi:hypothetical protein